MSSERVIIKAANLAPSVPSAGLTHNHMLTPDAFFPIAVGIRKETLA